MFSGGMVVEPNKIDWDFVFSNMDFYSNPTLYVTQIVVFIFFLLAVVWARRQDKKDIMKVLKHDPYGGYMFHHPGISTPSIQA